MEYEWDVAKAISNLLDHGVDFREAQTIFEDPLAATIPDPDHSSDEDRRLTMGHTDQNRLLVVWHVDRGQRSASSARAGQHRPNGENMNQENDKDRMREEYDFTGAERGKYYLRATSATARLTVTPSPFVMTITAGAPAGVKGVSRTIITPPAQSPKVEIGDR